MVVAGFTDAGGTLDFALARYNANGTLDATFGSGGKVITDFGGDEIGFAVALQRDGKIVAAGIKTGANGDDFALARYKGNGSLDPSFGGRGKLSTDFGGLDQPEGIALQRDGKIVVVGLSFGANAGDGVLARYNTDGSLDKSFDGDGKVTTDFGADDELFSVALQRDGKMIVAGVTNAAGTDDLLVARYHADGSLDNSFDGDGKVTTDFGAVERASAITIQRDGKIVAAGLSTAAGTQDFALARYNADGSLDNSFGAGGTVTTDFGGNEQIAGVALSRGGKMVVAGVTDAAGARDFALARYNADGSLDNSFDHDGKLITDFGGQDSASAIALKGRGKMVVAGFSDADGSDDFAVARYLLK
jgi:uncharacterized delta-60 repeat protein